MSLTIEDVASVCGHYDRSDALFLQGYSMLLDSAPNHATVLEICAGRGDLSGWLGQRTTASVIALDACQEYLREAENKYGHLRNVSFVCGDAMDLSAFAAETFDVIVGQAAMHHLAGNLTHVSKEYRRVMKNGGRLMFIFEPLGHNPLVAAIRAVRNTRTEWVDESNLFAWVLNDFASSFSRYEVYYFGLFAYLCKILPRKGRVAGYIYHCLNACDQNLFARWPKLRQYAANFNVCYWK